MTNGLIIRKKQIYLLKIYLLHSCQHSGTWHSQNQGGKHVGASCSFDSTSVEFLVKLPNIWLYLNACLLRFNSQRDSNLKCEIGEGGKQVFGSNFIVAPGDARLWPHGHCSLQPGPLILLLVLIFHHWRLCFLPQLLQLPQHAWLLPSTCAL